MIIGYGNYSLSFAIASSGAGAAFLTSANGLTDARTGSVTSMSWATGTQTTASTVTLTVTISDPLDSTAAIGVVGIANVQNLPLGTKVVVNGVTQRLTAGARGDLGAWWLPNITGNTLTITFYNDVAGSVSGAITAGMTWGIGEIFIGRAISLPTMVGSTAPTSDLNDPTAFTRSSGGQLWALTRKPYRQCAAQLGPFTTQQATGGVYASTLSSGGNPAGVIDVKTLREYLSQATAIAICDVPSQGQGAGSVSGGIRYDQSFMQPNWMVARMVSAGTLQMDNVPLWSWNPAFQEAT